MASPRNVERKAFTDLQAPSHLCAQAHAHLLFAEWLWHDVCVVRLFYSSKQSCYSTMLLKECTLVQGKTSLATAFGHKLWGSEQVGCACYADLQGKIVSSCASYLLSCHNSNCIMLLIHVRPKRKALPEGLPAQVLSPVCIEYECKLACKEYVALSQAAKS